MQYSFYVHTCWSSLHYYVSLLLDDPSPPQPLYLYDDIPTALSNIASLIQINPQVSIE